MEETGYQFDSGKRVGVYLSNTLEDASLKDVEQLSLPGMDELIAQEAIEGAKIKKQEPVMVVIGNPPYSGHSDNKNQWIKGLINTYKKDCSELQKPGQAKWLNDDYVKFFRFAQWRIDKTFYGILAFVTNHGYLDNPTFRGMRQSLMDSFNEIFVLNLHGSSKKKESSPDGSKDENVFDIQQGVAINLSIKNSNKEKHQKSTVKYLDIWGLREDLNINIKKHKSTITKYRWLYENELMTTEWKSINPLSPLHLFIPQNTSLKLEYDVGWKISDIFSLNGDPAPGIVTTHDDFAISWSEDETIEKVENLLATKTEIEARKAFKLCSQNQWQYERAKNELQDRSWHKDVTEILYRPFDVRWTVFNRNVAVHRRERVMQHILKQKNLGLSTTRSIEIGRGWEHIFCTDLMIQHHTVSIKEVNYLFPLYLYPNPNNPKELEESVRPNLSSEFLKDITSKLGYTPTPEAIFYYIYAIFHSPTYRTRYAEFLKRDFPRVPLTSNKKLFQQLSAYGEELVAFHLMKSPKLDNLITQFVENGGGKEVAIGTANKAYTNNKVTINKKGDGFTGVPEAVWNFHVGGYQVCHKWLKDRKKRTLSQEDIQHYQRIVVALQETIKLMNKIDQAIPEFPIT